MVPERRCAMGWIPDYPDFRDEGDMGSNLQNSFDSPQAPTAHTFTFSGAVCGAGIAKFLDNLSGVLLTSYKIGLHEIHFEG